MQTEVLIIDDFLTNPDSTRSFALSQQFVENGNYPGSRTESFYNESIHDAIQRILKSHGGEITQSYGYQYQLTFGDQRSWVHSDVDNTWAGVLYLSPDAPAEGGTGIYRHKETGLYRPGDDPVLNDRLSDDGADYTKWELVDTISNRYNRLVLYRGDLFHSSMQYFGNSMETGRLFQVFFLTTEF